MAWAASNLVFFVGLPARKHTKATVSWLGSATQQGWLAWSFHLPGRTLPRCCKMSRKITVHALMYLSSTPVSELVCIGRQDCFDGLEGQLRFSEFAGNSLRATVLGQDRSKPCCMTLIIKYSWRSHTADSDNGREQWQTKDVHCMSCPVCSEALHSISALILFPHCSFWYLSYSLCKSVCACRLCTRSQLPAVLTCLICLNQGLPCMCAWSSTSGYWLCLNRFKTKTWTR